MPERTEDEYLQSACRLLKVQPSQIMVHRLQADDFVVVINMGIAGCPKHTFAIATLEREIAGTLDVPPTAAPEVPASAPAPSVEAETPPASTGAQIGRRQRNKGKGNVIG
jgi:hypothetical protein